MKIYKTYQAAERNAEKMGLQLAEYGILSSGKGYCYWNESGDRNDRAIIYCEYNWTRDGRAI